MGVTEETGQTARSVVESLSSTPMILAVLIFNILYLGGTAYMFVTRNQQIAASEDRWSHIVEVTMKTCQQPPDK